MQKNNSGPLPDRLFALLLALAYLLVGLVWVGYSDEAGGRLFTSAASLASFQTWKGGLFVTLTAILLFVVAARRTREGMHRLPRAPGPSLRALLTGLVLVTAAPLVVLLGYNLLRQTSSRVDEAKAAAQTAVAASAARAQAFLDSQRRLAQVLARRPQLRAVDRSRCDPLLPELATMHEELRNIVVLDAAGARVCAARPGAHVPVAVASLAAQPQGVLSAPVLLPQGPVVALTVPFVPDGGPPGSVQLLVDLSAIERRLVAETGEGGSSALVSESGYVLARKPEIAGLAGRQVEQLEPFVEVLRSGGDSLVTRGIDDVERLYVMRRIGSSGLVAVAGVDLGRTFGPVRAGALRSLGMAAAVVLLATLLIAALLRRIRAPMGALAQAADAVAAGRMDQRAPEGGPRELAGVARQFNRMLDTLKESQQSLLLANEQLEARVAERTQALAAANESLESFSYSVAHDLRAPLHAIEGFAEALPQLLAQGQHARVERLVQRIGANTARMEQMIDGLLAVARAGRGELAEAPVALESMVREVLAELEVPPGTEVRVAPLPELRADPLSLRQVWWNLLANALKFSAGRPQPRIEVGWERRGEELVFHVRDNGAGFDPQYAGRLFTAFQRLHDAAEFEGTGVGLALARRVVEHHGGRIWAESAPDAGATFWFSLPASRALGTP